MNPETIKWLVPLFLTLTGMVVGAVVWLTVLTFRLGQKYGSVEKELERFGKATEKLERSAEKLDQIPVLGTKVGTLEGIVGRLSSEWPEMRSKVAVLYDKVFSVANWRRKSRPEF